MPKPKPPYPSEFRTRVVDLARSGLTHKSLARRATERRARAGRARALLRQLLGGAAQGHEDGQAHIRALPPLTR
jgi:hypothetical protein